MGTPITVGDNSYNLIAIPSYPGVSQISLSMTDSVATVESPFVPSQVQSQVWPGADKWTLEFTLPKMTRQTAAPWRGWMAELQGMANVFQMGDPFAKIPQGVAHGTPVCDTTGTTNLINTFTLLTSGWTPSVNCQLMAGDYIQIGWHLYVATQNVDSADDGTALFNIWPSLRETPADDTPLVLMNTLGLFRLSDNTRTWHADYTNLTQISLKASEAR